MECRSEKLKILARKKEVVHYSTKKKKPFKPIKEHQEERIF